MPTFPYRWEEQKLCLQISVNIQHLPLTLELRGSVVFAVVPAEWNTAISLKTFVIWGAACWKLRQKYYPSPFACEMSVSLCINTGLFTIVFLNNGDLKRPHRKAVSVTVGRAFICKACNLFYNGSLLIWDYSFSSGTFQKGNTFVWI